MARDATNQGLSTGLARGLAQLVAPTVVAMVCVAGCASAGESLRVEQARLGNVFFSGEPVQIPLRSDASRIEWRVEDFSGGEIASGTLMPSQGHALLEPAVTGDGYFEVQLEAKDGEASVTRAETSFVIIAPPAGNRTAESPFGVMTHFAQGWDRDILPLIAAAGIRHIRDEQYWDDVEPEPAIFDFSTRYTAYMAEAAALGLEPLIVMSFGNRHYDDGLTPYTDAGRAGYARYGRAILDQYGPQIEALEVWNEYNGSFAEGPAAEDRANYYTAMLKEAYREIKGARPDVKVMGGAAALVPLPWLETMFAQGGLAYMDGVVVHPYRYPPEGVDREIGALRELIAAYNGGAAKPIWATEFGVHDDSEQGRRNSAAYLVKMSTLMLAAGVERMYWYLLRDYRTDVSNFESMGLLRDVDSPFGRYAPAPAYAAYATLIRELEGAAYLRREPTDPRSEVHLFEKDGEQIRVAWSAVDAPRLQLETAVPLTRVDLMGKRRELPPSGGAVNLVLSTVPVYVKGPVTQVAEWRTDTLIADSVLDFSESEQAGAWRYGHYDGDGEGDGVNPGGPYSDDDFELLQPVSDQWRRAWGDPELGPVGIDEAGGHPGTVAEGAVWAVRRWLSPLEGTIRIRGEVASADDGGDGTEVRILNDGVPIFSTVLTGTDGPTSYDVETTVAEGTAIDFAITPGPDVDVDHDATLFSAAITVPLLADSVRDYSAMQGANGWHYGYYHPDAGGAAEPPDVNAFEAFPPGSGWGQGTDGPLSVNRMGAHPTQDGGRPVPAVRRWISDTEGQVRISGELAVWQNAGDGVRAWILVDGAEVLALRLGGPDQPDNTTYEAITSLREGSVVDFVLDPGPDADIDYDGSMFTAAIEKL